MNGSGVTYFIDGAQVATNSTVLPAALTARLSEFTVGAPALVADWVHLNQYPVGSGTFVSSVIDLGATRVFDSLLWTGSFPGGTSANFQTRSSADGINWSAWSAVASNGGAITSPQGDSCSTRSR